MKALTDVFLAATVLVIAAPSFAQENAVVCVDATQERRVVVVRDIAAAADACPVTGAPFLAQGRRSQLRVLHRKFLSDYTFTLDGSTSVQQFRIEDLTEAASLTTPLSSSSSASSAVSKGAVPKGLAGGGTLTLRTAQDLLGELGNPATSSSPAIEIQSDWVVVQNEMRSLAIDLQAFNGIWNPLYGPVPPDDACLPAYGDPTLQSISACLGQRVVQAHSAPFAIPHPSDEDAFRQLIVTDIDAVTMVNTLAAKLNQQAPALATQLSALEGDLTLFRADSNILTGNIKAALDAVALVDQLPRGLAVAQIKARLIQGLNANGSKAVLDPTELNALADNLYRATQEGTGRTILQNAALNLRMQIHSVGEQLTASAAPFPTTAAACQQPTLPGADGSYPPYAPPLNFNHCLEQASKDFALGLRDEVKDVDTTLPLAVDAINAQQSALLARTNQIYDRSRVDLALDKVIDLSSVSGNAYVGFTIRRVDYFSRFVVPPLTTQGALPTTSSSTVSPSSSSSTSPTTTTSTAASGTTTTTTTTTTSPASSSSSDTSGTVVAHGLIELHDVYQATVVAAFAFSGAHETSVSSTSVVTGTASDGVTACTSTSPCSQATVQQGSTHSSVIVGLSYHFLPYDTFPGRYSFRQKNSLKHWFGVFGGSSVQNLNDYYAGLSVEPANGIQFLGGVNLYRQDSLASGYKAGGIYPGTPTFTGPPSWSKGAYFGLGLNLSIFRKLFGSATGIGTSTSSNSGN